MIYFISLTVWLGYFMLLTIPGWLGVQCKGQLNSRLGRTIGHERRERFRIMIRRRCLNEIGRRVNSTSTSSLISNRWQTSSHEFFLLRRCFYTFSSSLNSRTALTRCATSTSRRASPSSMQSVSWAVAGVGTDSRRRGVLSVYIWILSVSRVAVCNPYYLSKLRA